MYKLDTFINENIPFIFNNEIFEYDMKTASFSLVREYNLLDKKIIKNLERMISKESRTVEIGKLQNSVPKFKEELSIAFQEARKLFIEANELEKENIISIKKDAIFTNKQCKFQKFGDYINFRQKHYYTSYINLGRKLEIYYSPNDFSVKGISDEKLVFHEEYMSKFLKSFMNKMETDTCPNTVAFTRRFIDKYKRKDLDVGYYRTFDHRSRFIINDGTEYEMYFNEDIEDVDIGYNYFNILLKIIQIPL